LFIIGLIIGVAILASGIAVLYHSRKIPILNRRPLFLVTKHFGCLVLLLSVFVSIGLPSATTCYLQLIFLILGFDLFYIPFLVKAIRLYALYKMDYTRLVRIEDWHLYSIVVGFLFIDCFIMIAWFVVYPINTIQTYFDTDIANNYYYFGCDADKGFLIAILVYKTIICAITWIISDLSSQIGLRLPDKRRRQALKKINDASEIKFGISFTLILLVIVLMVLLVVTATPVTTFIAIAITVYIAMVVPLSPIMYITFKDLARNNLEANPTTNSTMNSEVGKSKSKGSSGKGSSGNK